MKKVRCADCNWCCDLRFMCNGELVNHCKKLEKDKYKWNYNTLHRNICIAGYEYKTKAKIQYKK